MRPQPGQARSAANLTRLLAGSQIVASHRYDDPRVQDAYSVRCSAGERGHARHVGPRGTVAAAELRSAIDNPVVLPDGRVESCGTFTARRWRSPATSWPSRPPRWARSRSAARTACSIRAARTGSRRSHRGRGVNSGTDARALHPAAMVAENRRLCVPASADSLPTSAMQEDHVSMGWGAARKLRTVVANLGCILAVELTCAARALDLRAPLGPGPGTAAALAAVRGSFQGPGRTAGWLRSWRRPRRWSPRAPLSRRSRARSGASSERRADRPRSARGRAIVCGAGPRRPRFGC